MTRSISKWLLPFLTLVFIVSCKPALESELAETGNISTVDDAEIESVSTLELLQLIRTTGNTYQNENFKTARYCANCLAQRRLDEVAESMLQSQLKFLQGVFVDGVWGDFKMVVYDAPSVLYSSAKGLYDLNQRMNSFLASYGSMVSEYYTGKDYLGYGSENARSAIDKTVNTLMSMTQFLQTKGYAAAEALAKQLYMLYKNPSLLKNAIYDTVRLLSSGLSAGHGFARTISCATIVSLFDNWIPRLMGMVTYEVLIDVVLGFVTVGTAGAAGAVLGAKVGVLIAKLGRIAAKMPYIDELIAGLKKLSELVIRLVKRGEDVAPLAKNGDELVDGASASRKIVNPCRVLGLSAMCKITEPTVSSWKKHGSRLYADLKNVFRRALPFKQKDPNVRSLVALEYQKLIDEGTLRYLGFADDVHDSYHVYEYGGSVYLASKDGALVSRWAQGAQGRGNERIMDLLSKSAQ